MLRDNKKFTLLLFILMALFCLAMAHLFWLRFKSGDIYPQYSSLRADPLGTKALYDALSRMASINVQRNYDAFKRLPEQSCIFVLGVVSEKTHMISQKELDQIMGLVNSGCRLVIAFTPGNLRSFSKQEKTPPKEEADEPDTPSDCCVDLFEEFKLSLEYDKTARPGRMAEAGEQMPAHLRAGPLPWPSPLWFDLFSEEWKSVLVSGEQPVVVEKRYQTGSIVLAADSYVFSNESLLKNNGSSVLAYLCGSKQLIILDETHLGVTRRAGISTLIRKYNLAVPVVLLGIFVLLFVWKNAYSLIPPDKQNEMVQARMAQSRKGSASAKDHMAGLVNLLKIHIEKPDLIRECINAWKGAFLFDNESADTYAKRYRSLTPDSVCPKTNLVDEYNRISRILWERKTDHG